MIQDIKQVLSFWMIVISEGIESRDLEQQGVSFYPYDLAHTQKQSPYSWSGVKGRICWAGLRPSINK